MNNIGPVNDLVPHRPPMSLLDEVLSCSEQVVRCAVTIRTDDLFVEEGSVDAVLALEYMAQCAAVYGGLQRRAEGLPVKVGFLVGCPQMTLSRARFDVGTRLIVESTVVWTTEEGMAIFDTRVLDGDDEVAAAKLYVYQGAVELHAQEAIGN